jgi:hypothetical protein
MSREVATETQTCGDCMGSGQSRCGPDLRCEYCGGSGRVETYASRQRRKKAIADEQAVGRSESANNVQAQLNARAPQPALDAGDTYQCDACGKIVPSDEVKSGMPSAGVEGTFCHECRHGKDCDCLGREVDGGAFQRDTSKAITDLTAARESHIAWAAHLRQPHTFECQGCIDHAAHIGDAEYHDEWIVKYDNAIRVLRVAAQIVALPALDTGGEWRVDDKYIMKDGVQIGSFITAEMAAISVADHSSIPKLAAALGAIKTEWDNRNSFDSDDCRDFVTFIGNLMPQIDAALAPYQLPQPTK